MKGYIYTLSDPVTNEVKYVGCTKHLKQRRNSHRFKCASKDPKSLWANGLIGKGLTPIFNIVEEIEDEMNHNYWERFYIELFNHWGFDLLNVNLPCLGYRTMIDSELRDFEVPIREHIKKLPYPERLALSFEYKVPYQLFSGWVHRGLRVVIEEKVIALTKKFIEPNPQ